MTKAPYKIGVVGVGEIAKNQHIPSINRNPNFEFTAGVSRHQKTKGVDNFTAIEEMISARPDIDVVSLCVPSQVRYGIAWAALEAGKHVMLEKPPGISVVEVESLARFAEQQGATLFATWHSRYAAAVETAKNWLADKKITDVKIIWKEDVKHWHPGQTWIWQAGGMGVFDSGINALSILTHVMNVPFHLQEADLAFPSNCETPIAAQLKFVGNDELSLTADFDWRQTGPQHWDIYVQTTEGEVHLANGGNDMLIDGKVHFSADNAEYDNIYARFAELLKSNQSDIDLMPLKHVADAFLLGKRSVVEAFEE